MTARLLMSLISYGFCPGVEGSILRSASSRKGPRVSEFVYSAAMSIIVSHLLFTPLGPNHPGVRPAMGWPILRVGLHSGGTSFSDIEISRDVGLLRKT